MRLPQAVCCFSLRYLICIAKSGDSCILSVEPVANLWKSDDLRSFRYDHDMAFDDLGLNFKTSLHAVPYLT